MKHTSDNNLQSAKGLASWGYFLGSVFYALQQLRILFFMNPNICRGGFDNFGGSLLFLLINPRNIL